MSERYYVVSEAEIQELYTQALNAHMRPNLQPLKDADAACRARPVPEWATYFTAPTDGSTELADEERGFRFKEIKR